MARYWSPASSKPWYRVAFNRRVCVSQLLVALVLLLVLGLLYIVLLMPSGCFLTHCENLGELDNMSDELQHSGTISAGTWQHFLVYSAISGAALVARVNSPDDRVCSRTSINMLPSKCVNGGSLICRMSGYYIVSVTLPSPGPSSSSYTLAVSLLQTSECRSTTWLSILVLCLALLVMAVSLVVAVVLAIRHQRYRSLKDAGHVLESDAEPVDHERYTTT